VRSGIFAALHGLADTCVPGVDPAGPSQKGHGKVR